MNLNSDSSIGKTRPMITTFICSYFLMYMFPEPLTNFPLAYYITSYYSDFIDGINQWVGASVLGIPDFHKIEYTGSGDTTFDYVKLVTVFGLSLIVGIIFIFLRKKVSSQQLRAFTKMYGRYYVGINMCLYGIAKMVGRQFYEPGLFQLEQTYGNVSPMNLLWTFMGQSQEYSWFTGIGELMAGLLLFFRRTSIIGGILTLFIMINVWMLNMCYDVPVKLFSFHLVAITFFIISDNIINLWRYFMKGENSALQYPDMVLNKRWMRITRIVLKSLVLLLIPATMFLPDIMEPEEEDPFTSMKGVYNMESFRFDKDSTLLAYNDQRIVKKLILGRGYATLRMMGDSATAWQYELDSLRQEIHLTSQMDSTATVDFSYRTLETGKIQFRGFYMNDTATIVCKKKTRQDYPLAKRGFHWINEYPYNY